MKNFIIAIAFLFTLTNCDSDTYSTGESVGTIETVSQSGHWYKSYELQLFTNPNRTILLSFDGDKDNSEMIQFAKECQENQAKVRIFWHEEKNFSQNFRGSNNFFIDSLKLVNKP